MHSIETRDGRIRGPARSIRRGPFGLAAAAAAAAAVVAAVVPQAAEAQSVAGAWGFSGSGFSGVMIVNAPTGPDRYPCTFNIVGTNYGAEETCVLIRSGSHIRIMSSLKKAPTAAYQPDNFSLEIQGDRLVGKLLSSANHDVVFER